MYSTISSMPAGRGMDAINRATQAMKASNPSLTSAQAMTAALKQYPELYDQYLAANPAQMGR